MEDGLIKLVHLYPEWFPRCVSFGQADNSCSGGVDYAWQGRMPRSQGVSPKKSFLPISTPLCLNIAYAVVTWK